jgi:hypothetical protein
VQESFANLAEDTYPEMRRLAGHLAAPTTDRHFHAGLRWLLDGIESAAEVSRPSPAVIRVVQ